jgi:hypothetical protein
LPIEYYDAKVLHSIGDRIGRTVKVDKNTLTQERGKYARLCVEVDLTKRLLAMFSIKKRKYNVEYEGLHLLCITCGKFGHYKEGCPEKLKQQESNGGDRTSGGSSGVLAGSEVDGPWVVVQKPRRQRKGKERDPITEAGRGKTSEEIINGDASLVGSHFAALSNNIPELNENYPIIIGVNEREKVHNESENNLENDMEGINLHGGGEKRIKNKKGNGGAHVERLLKTSKLATRGTQSFKGKAASNLKKGVENISGYRGENNVDMLWEGHVRRSNDVDGQLIMGVQNNNLKIVEENFKQGAINGSVSLGQNGEMGMGHNQITLPNIPRPPNLDKDTTTITSKVLELVQDLGVEKEVFVDASENGTAGDSESDMEIVEETPKSNQ